MFRIQSAKVPKKIFFVSFSFSTVYEKRHEKTKTMIVLIAVPKFEFIFLMPIFDNTAAIPTKNADKTANASRIETPGFFTDFLLGV